MHIWRAGRDEVDDVGRLMIAFRDHFGESWPSDNAMLAGVEKLLDDVHTDFLLGAIAEGERPQAVAQLRFRHGVWRAGTECLLEDLFVQEGARGSGLGRAMLEAVLARARERGARLLELDTHEDNAAALALYESVGMSARRTPDGPRRLFLRMRLDDDA